MSGIDRIIHQPVRLRIMAVLVALGRGDKVDFTYLRRFLRVTDGNLGAHLEKLEDAGYVAIAKTFVMRRPRTYISATAKGRSASRQYTSALKEIIGGEQKTDD